MSSSSFYEAAQQRGKTIFERLTGKEWKKKSSPHFLEGEHYDLYCEELKVAHYFGGSTDAYYWNPLDHVERCNKITRLSEANGVRYFITFSNEIKQLEQNISSRLQAFGVLTKKKNDTFIGIIMKSKAKPPPSRFTKVLHPSGSLIRDKSQFILRFANHPATILSSTSSSSSDADDGHSLWSSIVIPKLSPWLLDRSDDGDVKLMNEILVSIQSRLCIQFGIGGCNPYREADDDTLLISLDPPTHANILRVDKKNFNDSLYLRTMYWFLVFDQKTQKSYAACYRTGKNSNCFFEYIVNQLMPNKFVPVMTKVKYIDGDTLNNKISNLVFTDKTAEVRKRVNQINGTKHSNKTYIYISPWWSDLKKDQIKRNVTRKSKKEMDKCRHSYTHKYLGFNRQYMNNDKHDIKMRMMMIEKENEKKEEEEERDKKKQKSNPVSDSGSGSDSDSDSEEEEEKEESSKSESESSSVSGSDSESEEDERKMEIDSE